MLSDDVEGQGADGWSSPLLAGTLPGGPAVQSPSMAEDLWGRVAGAVREQIAVLDASGTIIEANDAWREAARAEGVPHGFVGTSYLQVCDASEAPQARHAGEAIRAALAGILDPPAVPYQLGDRFYLMRVRPITAHARARAVVVHADVTDEAAAERSARERAELLDEIDVAVAAVDADGAVVAWNAAAERVFGWTRADALGRLGSETLAVDLDSGPWGALSRRMGEELVTMRRRDASRFPARHRARPRTVDGRPAGVVTVTIDATEEARALRGAKEAADFLTAVTDSMAEGLCVLDVEGRLVMMNEAAEQLLGWRFEQLEGSVLHQVCHAWRPDGSPYPVEDCPLTASFRDHVTVRVRDDVFLTRDGRQLPVSYAAAPLADRGGCVVVFSDATAIRAEEQRLRQELEDLTATVRIRDALNDDRLELFAQPIVRADTGEVVQRELLLRVPGPDGVLHSPIAFLTDADRLGLSGIVDRWVVRRALELAVDGMPVEVNVSAASLSDVALLDDIAEWVTELSVDPALVVFEITETALIADLEAGRAFVSRLRELGCGIALDDFGTGYGGFTYLKKLAIDCLKIDIEFVADLVDNEASRHVVRAVVHLARSFGVCTVAEGVENQETWDLLRDLGVDCVQGFFPGPPQPLERRPEGKAADHG